MKGINAFSAMSGVDDRFVMASLLPADLPGGASATAKVRKQEKDNWFTRMTSSGWFAAAVSLVVAFGVLAGIVAAGRMAPQNPSHGPGSGFPAGTLQNMPESEHDESDESHDPHEDGSDIPVETSPVINDPSEPQKGPVAVISDGITVYPIGYLLESTYYDAEKQEYVTKQYPGAILESLLFASSSDGLPGLTVDTQTVLNLFTADAYEVKSVKVYEFNGNELSLMKDDDNPFVAPIETDYCGSYVVVITANDGGTGEMHTLEFPFWLFVEDPNDGPAITEGPVEWGTGEIEPPTTTPAVKVHGSLRSAVFPTVRDGYRLWSEEWVDGSMASGMGLGAHGQLADILDEISAYNAVDGVRNPITVTLGNAGDTLIRVSVYDKELNHVTDGQDALVLSELDAGTYIVVLTVVSVGDYIPEAEANERYCTEYAFVLELYAPEPEPPEPVTEAIP